jgi:hypothetical protein
MSQKERILGDLRASQRSNVFWHGYGVVCGSFWLDARIPRYAARIHELRSDGERIGSGWCRVHKTATYTLGGRDE